jgi:AraC-like DNA-binding protein
VWVPAGVAHAVGSARGYQLHTLYLTTRLAREVNGSVNGGLDGSVHDCVHGGTQRCAVVAVSPLLGQLLTAAAAFGMAYPPKGPAARLMGVLLEQLPPPTQALRALHLPDPQDPRLRRLVAPLHRNPADLRGFDRLAAEIGLTARHASRAFVADTGLSPGQWRLQRRLLAALECLALGYPVRRVALQVGYADVSSFIAVFKRAFGVTPSRYFAAAAPGGNQATALA